MSYAARSRSGTRIPSVKAVKFQLKNLRTRKNMDITSTFFRPESLISAPKELQFVDPATVTRPTSDNLISKERDLAPQTSE